jgi:hypothetical protein
MQLSLGLFDAYSRARIHPGHLGFWRQVGAWYVFDPRNNAGRIGQIIIARGHDAGHVVKSTAFGTAWRQTFRV